MRIHPLAVIHESAKLPEDLEVGPFCVIEADVSIGAGCVLESHVVIKQGTTLGAENHVCEGAVLGGLPQHARCPAVVGKLIVGSGNMIREHTTMHRALDPDHYTTVGDQSLFMAGTHIAHDCHVGDSTIFANNATLGGHVVVQDRAYISGNVAVHQFCRVGTMAMVGGLARVVKDVPPYVTIDGNSGFVVGLNTVGLRRNGLTTDEISDLKAAYRVIYRGALKWTEILERLRTEFPAGPAAAFHAFLAGTHRGIVQERRLPPSATVKLSEEAVEDAPLRIRAG